jgi:hypothetical protein
MSIIQPYECIFSPEKRSEEEGRMPQSTCMKIRLKPEMTGVYLDFTKQVLNRMDELMASMREQEIIAEHIFLDRSKDGDFIYFYLKSEDLAKTRDIFYSSKRKIDREMIEIIDATWDSSQATRLEPVVEI